MNCSLDLRIMSMKCLKVILKAMDGKVANIDSQTVSNCCFMLPVVLCCVLLLCCCVMFSCVRINLHSFLFIYVTSESVILIIRKDGDKNVEMHIPAKCGQINYFVDFINDIQKNFVLQKLIWRC